MPKRAFVIHGWDGSPGKGWIPWLKSELEKRSFSVTAPQMPDAAEPRISKWVPALAELVGTPDVETYFIGHSMGNQAIIRYLEGLKEGERVGGAVFVAGFMKTLNNLEEETFPDGETVQSVATEWLTSPLDLTKVRSHLGRSVAIFSDNDPYVPQDEAENFRNGLGSETIILPGRVHFSGSTGTTELPEALAAVIKLSER